jgi:SAM-dependent methyltransferase
MTALESPNCPLCSGDIYQTAYEGAKFEPFGIKKCAHCGFFFLSPRLEESAMLAHYGQEDYFSSNAVGYVNYAEQEAALRVTFRRLLKDLAHRGSCGGSLLEIGCGHGYLLDEARPFFRRRVGTDFSKGAVSIARTKADEVHQGGVEAIVSTEVFDCIIATHVIEHVYHPHAFIQSLLQRLRPGGSLLIAAPDMGSYWRRLMGAHWPSFKLPEHILYFDRRTLTRLLVEAGLQSPTPVPYPHAFPLPLIASKIGVGLPRFLNRFNFWLPATTVAILGTKNDDRP